MNNKLKVHIYFLFVILFVGMAQGAYDYYATDKVSGTNLLVNEFEDEYGFIQTLIDEDEISRSSNTFKGDIGSIWNFDGYEEYIAKDLAFSGSIYFNDKSSVRYEIVDFVPEYTNVDDYGVTDVDGSGTLVYEMTIKIRKEIPVQMTYQSYQDPEDKSNFMNEIFITNKDEHLSLILENGDKQTFTHRRRCYAGCE